MNRKMIYMLIGLLSVIVLILIFVLVEGIYNKNMFNLESKVIYDKIYSIDKINSINISSVSADIEIINTNDNNVRIIGYGKDNNKINVSEKDKELIVDYGKDHNFCFGFCFSSKKIKVYLPAHYKHLTTIKTTSGDVVINRINNLVLETTSGDVNINKTSTSTIKTISGDINIKQVSDKVDITTTSGDIEIDNFNVKNNSKIKTVSGDVEIDMINSIYIDTKTVSGDVNIHNNNRFSDTVLEVKTTSGDIEIE